MSAFTVTGWLLVAVGVLALLTLGYCTITGASRRVASQARDTPPWPRPARRPQSKPFPKSAGWKAVPVSPKPRSKRLKMRYAKLLLLSGPRCSPSPVRPAAAYRLRPAASGWPDPS